MPPSESKVTVSLFGRPLGVEGGRGGGDGVGRAGRRLPPLGADEPAVEAVAGVGGRGGKVIVLPSRPAHRCDRGTAIGDEGDGVGGVRGPLGREDDGRAVTRERVGGAGGVGGRAVVPPGEGVARIGIGASRQGDLGVVDPLPEAGALPVPPSAA